MRDISLFLVINGGPDAIAQATSWAQKGLDVTIAARKSHKGVMECDSAYLILLFHLGWMQRVSVFLILFAFILFCFVLFINYIYYIFFRYLANTTKPVSR